MGAPDASLTAFSGTAALAVLVQRLDVVGALDRQVGPLKQRRRGVGAGGLLVATAQAQLLDGESWSALDHQRDDPAWQRLSAVDPLASTTAAGLARRFGADRLRGVEQGLAEVLHTAFSVLPAQRRAALAARPPTIDLDATDVEVYASKQGVAYNHTGQRVGRPHLATWAEAGVTLAADLLGGSDDVRSHAVGLLARALAGLPAQVTGRPRLRADSGYFSGELARAAVDGGCDFAIAARRNPAAWAALAGVDEQAWQPARGMPGAQVATCGYVPAGWPGSRCVVRRVWIEADRVRADSRSRRRRTMPPGTAQLALDGTADGAWAVSFIVTNLPVDSPADAVALEAWFRRRVDIEDRIREAKLGAALNHLPSGDHAANSVWMWGALLAGNLSVLLQTLTGLDADGRAHTARLRRQLLHLPARLVHHGRDLLLRLPPGPQLLGVVLARLEALPSPA